MEQNMTELPPFLQRIVDIGYGIDAICLDIVAMIETNPRKTFALGLLFSLEAGTLFASF